MKLLRFGPVGQEKPGALDSNGEIRNLSAVCSDIDGAVLQPESLARLQALDLTSLPLVPKGVRIGPCVSKVGKFICIGLNYADHAAESNMPIPEEPEVFSKFTSAISGPNDPIIKPKNSDKLDWEVELAIVIGKDASYISEAEAVAHIAGYCVCNDVSERTFQLERGNQWDKGKGCDSFGPIGPYLVTTDDIPNPNNLSMWLEVNGKRFQDGSTKTMIFQPAYIVSYLSQFTTLQAGDIVTTGTPPGVGLGQKPPLYLNVGDKITLGIEGLGSQQQVVKSV
ncbi:MAG: fumarylacetoacetate hydrolase family protein [Lentilitoribacter sp.]